MLIIVKIPSSTPGLDFFREIKLMICKKKYTKSVDIRVNDVVSRAGKATTHFYMPISQAKKN